MAKKIVHKEELIVECPHCNGWGQCNDFSNCHICRAKMYTEIGEKHTSCHKCKGNGMINATFCIDHFIPELMFDSFYTMPENLVFFKVNPTDIVKKKKEENRSEIRFCIN